MNREETAQGEALGQAAVGVFLLAFPHVMACFRLLVLESLFLATAAAAASATAFEASKTSSKLRVRHQKVPFSVLGRLGNSVLRARSDRNSRGRGGCVQDIVVCSLGVGGVAGGLRGLGSEQTTMAVSAPEEEKKNVGPPLPELLTEFMVDMKCEGCVEAVRSKVENLEGVKAVEFDLANQVVRILGSASVKSLAVAIEESGRAVRLIGQGVPSEFTVSAAVAEFKGPEIHGVVRFAHVSMEMSRIEANFSGLTPGKHRWSINMYGDLTRGAASTGGIYELESSSSPVSTTDAIGDLGTLEVGSDGATEFNGTKLGLQVPDLIGRAVVIYEDEDKSKDGISAAVIARSAGVGQNYKKLCSCDGTIIWEATNRL